MSVNLTYDELQHGCNAFRQREARDAMYRVAARVVAQSWEARDAAELADGLGVLLLTWNQALYRYGSFDFARLEQVLREEWDTLARFRSRNIVSFSAADQPHIRHLFRLLMTALQIPATDEKSSKNSPVAVAKALHLLAPEFFPLWDVKIGQHYRCFAYGEVAAERYCAFMRIAQAQCAQVVSEYAVRAGCSEEDAAAGIEAEMARDSFRKSLLKLVDEFNYAVYTKRWYTPTQG